MTKNVKNLCKDLPETLPEELIDLLAGNEHVRIERIVSTGHASSPDHWYDQAEHEWVMVVQGEAILVFDESDHPIRMKRGDHLLIPAHRRHRVEWTSPEEPTVWVAVFFQPGN